jgi:hypothetical protein
MGAVTRDFMAETLTIVREGGCHTSIINTTDEDANVSLPVVDVAECEIETNLIQAAFIAQGAVTREGRIQELRKRIRTDHLNDREKSAIINVCEYYNDIFKLPGGRLSTTTAVEHAIPNPGEDPCRGIASRNYQIPDAL